MDEHELTTRDIVVLLAGLHQNAGQVREQGGHWKSATTYRASMSLGMRHLEKALALFQEAMEYSNDGSATEEVLPDFDEEECPF